ncbi:Cytochrome P450 [Mycena indigotica]|uniref:Cytochrome P450 n=1 Tax=Mycena indigotica TaxID=2126181 RepID=A0A8H6TFY8_9AGAR|nr:Cytochrome P450 [Mycena indigotica]KAF7316002.1 Cytochrome P450 [Mycena indigotica]
MAHLFPALWAIAGIFLAVYRIVKRRRILRLRGPPSPSFVFGNTQEIAAAADPAELYDLWATTYGSVYRAHGPMGSDRLVICDPKALAHLLALDTWKYSHPPLALLQIGMLTGPGNLLSTFGESHTKQRKILNPLFAPVALKKYASVMYDVAYKVITAWETQLQTSSADEIIPDVSEWQAFFLLFPSINNLSFDIIGLAAFSTDFRSLDGEQSSVATALTAVGHAKPSPVAAKIFLLSQAFPILFRLPLPRSKLVENLSQAMDGVVDTLINAARSGKLAYEQLGSALGVLLSTKELSDEQMRIHVCIFSSMHDDSPSVVQAKSILLSGFATTASGIKWALVELATHPHAQNRLRKELMAFTTTDPSYEDLTSLALPYLDAVVREALRLHPILSESPRVALEDDLLPLSAPIRTVAGDRIDMVPVRKGTILTVSLYYTNTAKSIWGDDAAEFKPERWLDGDRIPDSAKRYPGYHHTMVFLDGPRTCLGKGFALAEIKACQRLIVLSLFIRKFVFAPRDGPQTQYERAMFLGPHPKVAGEIGGRLPIRVTRVES